MMKYEKLPVDFQKNLTFGSGFLCTDFDPETGEIDVSKILGAFQNNGFNINVKRDIVNVFDDIGNVPKNMKEGIRTDAWNVTCGGTLLTINPEILKKLLGNGLLATVTPTSTGLTYKTVKPTFDVANDDFSTLWYVTNYTDKNNDVTGTSAVTAGFFAVKMENCLSTSGFSFQSVDKEKGSCSFEFTAYGSISSPDEVPVTFVTYDPNDNT